MKPAYHGTYNPPADRSKLTIRERMKEDLIILVKSLPDFYTFTLVTSDFPIADGLFQGLQSMFVEKTILIWVAYSLQIYLDIRHVLRQDVGREFSESQTS